MKNDGQSPGHPGTRGTIFVKHRKKREETDEIDMESQGMVSKRSKWQ